MYALRDDGVALAIWVVCPVTGRVAPTVMRATPERFRAVAGDEGDMVCPDCGATHAWRSLRPHLAGDNPFR